MTFARTPMSPNAHTCAQFEFQLYGDAFLVTSVALAIAYMLVVYICAYVVVFWRNTDGSLFLDDIRLHCCSDAPHALAGAKGFPRTLNPLACLHLSLDTKGYLSVLASCSGMLWAAGAMLFPFVSFSGCGLCRRTSRWGALVRFRPSGLARRGACAPEQCSCSRHEHEGMP